MPEHDTSLGLVTLGQAFDEYINSLKPEQRNLQASYVRKYVEYTGSDVQIQDLSRARVESYVESQIRTSDPAAQERVTALKGWFKFLHKRGYTSENLGVQVRVKRVNSGRRRTGERQQVHDTVEMTAEGVEALRRELEEIDAQIPQLRAAIATAREDKDFRENAPLDAAREQMAFTLQRRKEIEAALKRAVVADGAGASDVSAVGSLVTVTRIDTESQTVFKLVGPREANAAERKISVESPVGKELLGRRVGDEVTVEVPSGVIAYRVDSVARG